MDHAFLRGTRGAKVLTGLLVLLLTFTLVSQLLKLKVIYWLIRSFTAFLAIALFLTFPVVITVNWLGSPDNGVILSAYIGSLMMAGAYLAITSMTSAMTRNQVVSFIISVVVCLFLILCGFPPVTNLLSRLDSPRLVEAVAALSVLTHFDGFAKGVLDSRDIIYFLSIIGFSLFTTGVIIRSHRAG